MTTRRRLLLFGLLAGLLTLGVGRWLLRSGTAITAENAAKIQKGMTLAEVEAILGRPEHNEAVGSLANEDLENGELNRALDWSSNRLIIRVFVGTENRVRFVSTT